MTTTHRAASTSTQRRIQARLAESALLLTKVSEVCGPAIDHAACALVEAFRSGGKLLLCGNGGSAADCQHIATELVSRLTKDFDRPALPAVALTTDTSILTGYVNDAGIEGMFARQVEALGKPGDVLLGISTSGGSVNVLRAVEAARDRGLKTVGLQGGEGPLQSLVDYAIVVPHTNTQYVQESLMAIEHTLCELVEEALFRAANPAAGD